jgi:hypothetical protein
MEMKIFCGCLANPPHHKGCEKMLNRYFLALAIVTMEFGISSSMPAAIGMENYNKILDPDYQ